jgi:acetylornithine/succinyldiaminopimelate/putrescine aminotransferase
MNPPIQVRPPGFHASTFGGNALTCAAGSVMLELASDPGFGECVTARRAHLLNGLAILREAFTVAEAAHG